MKFYNLLIKYRLQIGLVLIALGVYTNYAASFWPAFPLYLVGVILIAGHFFFGPLAPDPGIHGKRRYGRRRKSIELHQISQPAV